MNEKVEIRVRTPVRIMILERRNNFVSCVTFKVKIIFKNQGLSTLSQRYSLVKRVGTLSRVIKVYQEMYEKDHITIYSHVLPCIAMYSHVLPCITMYYHVLPCIAMYCHVLPCIAMYCHVLLCIAMYSHV